MKMPRLTTRQLLALVAIVAVDIAIVRLVSRSNVDIGIAFVTLPMSSLLILVAPMALSGDAPRSFWIGFEIAGWSVMALFGYLARRHGATFFWAANSAYPWQTIRDTFAQNVCVFSLDLAFYTPPEILAAWLGGLALARFRGADL